MPKRYIVLKWLSYGGATAVLLLIQTGVFHHIRLWGVVPFLAPMVVGVAASFEEGIPSSLFALVFGVLCDLGGATPVMGFFTFLFPLAALTASFLAENLFSPGFPCSLVSSFFCYLIVAGVRIILFLIDGETGVWDMWYLARREFFVSLPLLAVVFPLFRWVHRRTTFDY